MGDEEICEEEGVSGIGAAVDCDSLRAPDVGENWKLTGDATATFRTRQMIEDEDPEAIESFRPPPAVGKGANDGEGERPGDVSPVGSCIHGLGGLEISGSPQLFRTSRYVGVRADR
jgi:hypothetical protein